MKTVKAMIRWIKPSEGGRNSPPPGPRYSTVARFAEIADDWPQTAWSLVLEWTELPDSNWTIVANVSFLARNAPQELLHAGAVFELYEGRQCVAEGKIILP